MIALSMFLSCGNLNAQSTGTAPIEQVFAPTMSRSDLRQLERTMGEQGLVLNISQAKYRHGRLRYVAFSLETPAGKGTASGELQADRRFGFRYDPTPGSKVCFTVGTLQ